MIREIDAKGLACPKPVILTKKELDSLSGGSVRTTVDNETARENLSKLAKSMGLEYRVEELGGDVFAVTIIKSGDGLEEDMEGTTARIPDGEFVIAIQSDKMGKGDDELGVILMKSFIYTVRETSPHPKAILFYNGAVRLTTKGSAVVDDLKGLQDEGVEIISCGTCLDFFGLKEKLEVGEVSNMYTIYEKMQSASNTITIG